MASADPPAREYVLLGRVTKPHGIRGEVKVYPFSGLPENFLHYRTVLLGHEGSRERVAYTIERARVQGKLVLLQLEGCRTRNESEALVGQQVWLRRDDLPPLESDEFYLQDLEGKTVKTVDGRKLGKVTGIMETPAHDILAIRDGGREYLVPLLAGYIASLEEDTVVVDLPPGLLEMNGN